MPKTDLDLRAVDDLDAYLRACPSRNVVDSISDKWSMLALSALGGGTARYGDLKRRLEGISPKMLSQTLKKLERNGLVERTQYPEIPPRVTYELTLLGRELSDLMQLIKTWAEDHYPEIESARRAYDRRNDGTSATGAGRPRGALEDNNEVRP